MAHTVEHHLGQLEEDFDRRVHVGQWQIVHVVFPSTADTDIEIPHKLSPPHPEYVDVMVLRASGPPLVYSDQSPSRRAWGNGYVILRSAVGGLKADLLLTVSALRRDQRQRFEGGSKEIGRGLLPSAIAYEDEVNTFSSAQTLANALFVTAAISPAALASGSTNNYAPSGFATTFVLRLTPDATLGSTLTGLAAGVAGRKVVIINVGTTNLTLTHDDAGSSAANRFFLRNGASVILGAHAAIVLWYDTISSRWRGVSALF